MNEDEKKAKRIKYIEGNYTLLFLTMIISVFTIIYYVGFVNAMYFATFYLLMLITCFNIDESENPSKAQLIGSFVAVGLLLFVLSNMLWEYRKLEIIGLKLHSLGILHIISFFALSLIKFGYIISDLYKNSLLGLWIKAKKKQLRKEIGSSDNKKDE